MSNFPDIRSKVIAGPCSAESRAQVLDTAGALDRMGIRWFRAGLWKPRTRPDSFEGLGEKGIPWMKEVKSRYGMFICTEVASARHVEICLENGFDMVWLGARTTANPFLVEEIASALSGAEIKVFVKNPVNPDNGLWAGDIERLKMRGVRDISVIHRGFSTYEKTRFRNAPCWDMAIEFRSSFPDIPFYCDPSHMGGDAAYVGEIAQKAMDLGLDGLMVESHVNPSAALSDAGQQLTPLELGRMLDSLKLRNTDSEDEEYRRRLSLLRERIDELDGSLIDILSERMNVSREIGRAKKAGNVAIIQPDRWDIVMEAIREKSKAAGLDIPFITRIYNEIHDASVAEQNRIISEL